MEGKFNAGALKLRLEEEARFKTNTFTWKRDEKGAGEVYAPGKIDRR